MSKKRRRKKTRETSVPDDRPSEAAETVEEHEPGETRPVGETEPEAGAAAPDPDVSREETLEGLHAEIEKLRHEAAEMKGLAQRKQAEFENYRRRTERERNDFVRHAAAEFVLEILPVFDNLGRAVEAADAAADTGSGSGDQLREGVGIIYKQFKDILERKGLEEIECEGKPFDPHIHEAVSRVETNDHPDGSVVEVFQKGYRMKDRLLRPAMVSVARTSDDGDDSRSEDEEDEVLRQSD